MPSCSIKQCSTRRTKNLPELSVHTFPKSVALRQKWLEAIGTKNINARHKELYICSLHFEESQINRTLDVVRLRENAVPTFIMPPGDIHEQNTGTGTNKPRAIKTPDCNTPPGIKHEQPITEINKPREMTDSDCEMEMPPGAHYLVISADDSNPKGPRIKISPSIPNKQEHTTTINIKIERDDDGPTNSRHSKMEEVHPDKSCVLEACRVCLVTDCKMFSLKKRKLRLAYTKITGLPVSPLDGHPQLLCWQCAARVQSAAELRARAINAHGILDALFCLNGSVNMGDVRSINRQRAKLTSQLTCEYFEPDEYGPILRENAKEITKSEHVDNEAKYNTDDTKYNTNDVEYNSSDMYEEYIDEEFEDYEQYAEINDNIDCKNDIDDQQDNRDDKVKNEVYMTSDVEIIYDKDDDDDDDDYNDDDEDDDGSASENSEETNRLGRKLKKDGYKEQKEHTSRNEILSEFFNITTISVEDAKAAVRDRKQSEAYKKAPFKCDICYRGYPTSRRYEDHVLKHTEKFGKVECMVCKQRYKSRLHLVRHQNSHRRKYACKQCNVVTSTSTAALYHRASHDGAVFQCPHCPRAFNKKTTYYGHLRIKHVSEFVCELCGHTFLSKLGVEVHKNRRHVLDNMTPLEGPHCAACDVTFVSQAAHDTHLTMSSKHNTDRSKNIVNVYEPKPKRQWGERGGRMGRPRGVPSTRTPVTCEQCGEYLASVMTYVVHFRKRHPGETRTQHRASSHALVCEQCGRKFHCMSLLKDHIAAHRGVLLSCDECGKSFASKVRLGVHMKVHQPIRTTYPCKICGKRYTQSGNMQRHLRKHMTPLPYKCEACGKCLTTPTGLKSHVDHVHNGVPWPKRQRNRSKD